MLKLIVGLSVCLVTVWSCCAEAGKYSKDRDSFVEAFSELNRYMQNDTEYNDDPGKYFEIIHKKRSSIPKAAKNVLNLFYQLNIANKMFGQQCTDDIIDIIYLIHEVTKLQSNRVEKVASHLARRVAKLCSLSISNKLSGSNNLLTNPLTGRPRKFGKDEIEKHSQYQWVDKHWIHGPGFTVSNNNMTKILRLLAAGDPQNVYGTVEKRWNIISGKKMLEDNFKAILDRHRDTQCADPKGEKFNESIEQAYAISYYSYEGDLKTAKFNDILRARSEAEQDKIYRYYFCMIFYHLTPEDKQAMFKILATEDQLKAMAQPKN